jgi:hypothetical protein
LFKVFYISGDTFQVFDEDEKIVNGGYIVDLVSSKEAPERNGRTRLQCFIVGRMHRAEMYPIFRYDSIDGRFSVVTGVQSSQQPLIDVAMGFARNQGLFYYQTSDGYREVYLIDDAILKPYLADFWPNSDIMLLNMLFQRHIRGESEYFQPRGIFRYEIARAYSIPFPHSDPTAPDFEKIRRLFTEAHVSVIIREGRSYSQYTSRGGVSYNLLVFCSDYVGDSGDK